MVGDGGAQRGGAQEEARNAKGAGVKAQRNNAKEEGREEAEDGGRASRLGVTGVTQGTERYVGV